MTSNPASVGPAPDGEWIEWSGGENPVPGQRVEWLQRYQDHPSLTWGPRESEDCRWTHSGWDTDIIAYRIAPHPDREAEPKGGVAETDAAFALRHALDRLEQVQRHRDGKAPLPAVEASIAMVRKALSVSPPVVEEDQGALRASPYVPTEQAAGLVLVSRDALANYVRLHATLSEMAKRWEKAVFDHSLEPTFGEDWHVENNAKVLFECRPLADWEPAP